MTETSAHPSSGAGHARNPWIVLTVVCAGAFMQLVDVSIVNTAIPSIQRELSTSYGQIQLVLVLYSLGFAGTLITSARLGDIYGRRKIFMIGLVGFTAVSAVCGAAPTSTVLVGARFVQGVFAGLMFAQVFSVIQVTFPPKTRGTALGVFGAIIGIATITGPVLGGALIKLNLLGLDWRLIFYVNVPIGIAALFGAITRLPESRSPDAPRLDIRGAILVTAGLVMLVYGVTIGRQKGWPVWIIALIAASIPVLAAFVVYEIRKTRRNDSPLVIMTLFRDRAFSAGVVLFLVFFLALPPFFFLFSLYLQIGEGFSALGSGLSGVAFAVASGFASSRSELVARRLGNRTLMIGCALLVVGMMLLYLTVDLVGIHPHIYDFIGALGIAGFGLGLFIAPVVNVVLAGIHAEGAGSASGVLSTVQQLGAALGIAFAGILFFSLIGANASPAVHSVTPRLRTQLSAAGLPAPAVDGAVAGFRRCFHDRSHATDPTATPASCRAIRQRVKSSPAPPKTKRLAGAAFAHAGTVARGRGFSDAFRTMLFYEGGIFLVSLLLVFALPKVDPRAISPGGPPQREGEKADAVTG
jgi:EmrB/QacA subfamily drug resistance transporter